MEATKANPSIALQKAATDGRQSLDRKLSVRLILAMLCTTVLALTIVAPTFRDYTLARQNLHDIQQYRLTLDTATLLAAERGPANIVMSEDRLARE